MLHLFSDENAQLWDMFALTVISEPNVPASPVLLRTDFFQSWTLLQEPKTEEDEVKCVFKFYVR